jgi:hypothetical protein
MNPRTQLNSLSDCAALVACALLPAAGCGDDAGGDTPLDLRDRPQNGVIAIDELALTGEISDGELTLQIPLHSLDKGDAAGELEIRLIGVEDGDSERHTRGAYEVAEGDSRTVRAKLKVPSSLEDEPDQAWLVDFNVRIEQLGDRPLRVTRSLLHVMPIYEMRLEGPNKVLADKVAAYRASLQDPRTRSPIEDKIVRLILSRDGDEVEIFSASTDEVGSAVFEVEVEQPGDYAVAASVENAGTSLALSQGIDVEQPGQKVLLTTDKPIYQPGQTIHLRALALENPGNEPLTDREVTFEVDDAKGNKILKRTLETNGHGIASTKFAIANIVNMGTFKVRAIAGDIVGERTVEVSRYVLPKFDVELSVDRDFYTPGQ